MKFKTELIAERFKECSDVLKIIMYDIDQFSQNKFGKEITLTESKTTKSEDLDVGRQHGQHREGRAVDVRTSDLSYDEIQEIRMVFNSNYIDQAAIGVSSGIPNLILSKKDHLHIAIKPMNDEQTREFVSQWENYD